jgi:hypothetical protein
MCNDNPYANALLSMRERRADPAPTNPSPLELHDHLRGLGYDAHCVNGDCYDIHQNGYVHYLSRKEALSLDRGGLDLLGCSQRRGLNRWYDFSEKGTKR